MTILIAVVFAGAFEVQQIEILERFAKEQQCWTRVETIKKSPDFKQYKNNHDIGCIVLQNLHLIKGNK